jgi:hypothetical protein
MKFEEKVGRVFLPYKRRLGRLASRHVGVVSAKVEVYRGNAKIQMIFDSKSQAFSKPKGVTGSWHSIRTECVYIPVKEMLANAPGFRSLYTSRDIHFEEVYADIVDKAYLPILRGAMDRDRRKLLELIQNCIKGKVVQKNEEFFLKNKQGNLEFTLLAEGMRKLALIWLLIQNGTLLEGSILFWDEPEANLNPAMMRTVVEILLELQRIGVQIFLATHDYVLLKEFDLLAKEIGSVKFHALYEDASTIKISSTPNYWEINPNTIRETFQDLFNRDVERALK